MNVFVLSDWPDYETGAVLGVYETLEAAERAADQGTQTWSPWTATAWSVNRRERHNSYMNQAIEMYEVKS